MSYAISKFKKTNDIQTCPEAGDSSKYAACYSRISTASLIKSGLFEIQSWTSPRYEIWYEKIWEEIVDHVQSLP